MVLVGDILGPTAFETNPSLATSTKIPYESVLLSEKLVYEQEGGKWMPREYPTDPRLGRTSTYRKIKTATTSTDWVSMFGVGSEK